MSLLWFFILSIIGAVNCGDLGENYIVEILDDEITKTYNTPFKVYWNVPTKQCRNQKNSIPFDDILRKYGISYNKNDKFEGETITIIYDGGFIPAILKRDGAKFSARNGGLPQEGNLELHLTAFRETVIRLIPDPYFQGVGVIDMESWRPIFRQHWSKLASIIDLSLSIEKRHYWWWPSSWLKMEATKRFEDAARIFMEKTLSTAKQMRPKAIWGYYGFPYCFNMDKDMKEHCSTAVKSENDRTYWLWAESTALYPSLYSSSKFSTSELEALVRGRLTEANRVKQAGTLVLPYFWIKYREGDFIKQKDLIAVFEVLQKKNASGLVIWGASNDVNRIEKCKQLYNYINSYFGPIVKKYMQRINKVYDDRIKGDSKNVNVNGTFNNTSYINADITQRTILDTIKETTLNNNVISTEKSESISFVYEQEQLHNYYYRTGENITDINSSTESDVWDFISYEQTLKQENKSESNANIERYLSPSSTKLIRNDNSSLNDYVSKENLSNSSNHFHNISDNLVKIIGNISSSTFSIKNNIESNIFNDSIDTAGNLPENNIDPFVAITKNTVQNITNDLAISLVNLTETLNSSECKNSSGIVRITDPVATWSINENNSNNVNKFDAKGHLVNGSFHNVEETVSEKKNIFDDSVTSSVNLASPIDIQVNSYKIGITENMILYNNNYSIYNSQEEAVIENTTYQDVVAIDSRENDILDHLTTVKATFISSINTPVEKIHTETRDNLISKNSPEFTLSTRNTNYSKNISRNFKQEEQLIENATYQYIEMPEIRENDTSDYLITVGVNYTSPTNMSINGNDTRKELKYVESINTTKLNLLPSNYSERKWEDILENRQEEQIIQTATYTNFEVTISTEKDISDDSLTSSGKISSITTSVNGNSTDIQENVELENSLDFKSANNYSEAISQYIKLDEQSIKNTTDVKIKVTDGSGNEMPDYLIILAEDNNQMN